MFMVNEFKKWTGIVENQVILNVIGFCFEKKGIGKPEEMDRLHINPFDGSHVHYQDPITSFPDKMDQLLIALNKVKSVFFFA